MPNARAASAVMPVSSATWRSASRSWSGSPGGPSGPWACDPFIGQPYARLRQSASPERLASGADGGADTTRRPGGRRRDAEPVRRGGRLAGGPRPHPTVGEGAVGWRGPRGQTGGGGGEPFSSRESAISRIAEWASGGGLWLAEAPDG